MKDKDTLKPDYNSWQAHGISKELSKRIEEIRNKFRVPSDEYYPDSEKPDLAGRAIMKDPPVPYDPEGAFEYLKNYTAQIWLAMEIANFKRSSRTIQGTLKELCDWIADAEKIEEKDYTADPLTRVIKNKDSEKHEYMRLSTGFYKTNWLGSEGAMLNGGNTLPGQVYGRYFLFKEWLEQESNTPEAKEKLILTNTQRKYLYKRVQGIMPRFINSKNPADVSKQLNLAKNKNNCASLEELFDRYKREIGA